MSIQEDAARLKSLEWPKGHIQAAEAELQNLTAQAADILGQGATGFNEVAGAIQHAVQALGDAYNALFNAESVTMAVADRHASGGS